ncbi:MAG: metal ABC transporter permease [Candidatus Berkiella sp.]
MIDISSFDIRYLLAPLLGGIGVALVAGPLGSLMIWRRLAYLGDTLSHSGLLGITLALALHWNITIGVCLIAVLVALLLLGLQTRVMVARDTLLGLLSHTSLALGLLLLAALPNVRVDVLGFLYGDILAMSWQDVMMIYSGGTLVLGIITILWQKMLRVTVHAELAQVEGVNAQKIEAAYILLLAVGVAIAIKIVGVLLITALLLVPAATARRLAKSPEQMACWASVLGSFSVISGVLFSHFWDCPTGPAIVVSAAVLLLISSLIKK